MFRYLIALALLAEIAQGQTMPDAGEIMEKYAANRSKYESFIVKFEYIVRYDRTSKSKQDPRESRTSFHQQEFRFDGVRASRLETSWGNICNLTPNVPRGDPQFTCNMFVRSGEDYWYGRAGNSDIGDVTLDKRKQPSDRGLSMLTHACQAGEVLGYPFGDNERIEKVLQGSKTISVRKEMAQIGSSRCYVIDASSDHGQYTLWMDPQRGYSIVRATITRKTGDRMYKRILGAGERYCITVSNVELASQDGVWVPTGGDIEYVIDIAGKYSSHQMTRLSKMGFAVNPDHDALRSFDPNTVIRDGAKVNVRIESSDRPMKYIWQEGGKLAPDTTKPKVIGRPEGK
jgi:hypothetical protein